MADTKLAKVGITVKESWKDDISYEVLDYTLWRVQDGGDGCGYIAKRANIGVVPNSDDSVWIKATQAGQSIYDLAVKYGHFVGTEEEFEAEYQAVLQAARDAASETSATNTEIQEAEELRKTAENARVEAETARQTAETGRQTAETERQTAETARNTAETQRGENETTRQSQETARESSETQRQSNEATRQSNETARESAELERTADFEGLKTDMQTAIQQADEATAEAVALNNQVAGDESARQTAESGRVAAETQRQSNETQRGTNEQTRQTQETARQTAEQTRQTQEGTRQTQETARQTAEGNRASAESQRVSNETARQTAETAREEQATTDHQRAEEDHAIAEEDHATLDEKISHKADIDGSYDGMAVGIARNLEGRTDVTGSFFKRTTGGDAEVANGTAQLNDVKGKSQVWNQLVDDTDYTSGGGYSPTKTGHQFSCVTNIAASTLNIKLASKVPNHKYFISLDSSTEIAFEANIRIRLGESGTYIDIIPTNNLIKYSFLMVGDSVSSEIIRIVFTAIGSYIISNVNVIDLTLLFGAGNEPETVEEFEQWLAENIGEMPYYPYNPGEVLNSRMTGVESIGFNLLDPATGKAEIIGAYSDVYGNYYAITGTHGALTFTDKFGNTETITPDSDGKFLLEKAGTLSVADAGEDCAVFLWWDGTQTEYKPYEKNVGQLDVTHIYGKLNGEGDYVRVWPTGMPGIGDVKDSLKVVDGQVVAERKVGEVDMGSLGWVKGKRNNDDTAFIFAIGTSGIGKSAASNAVLNRKYPNNKIVAVWEDLKKGEIKEIAQYVIVCDDYQDVPSFKAAVSGILMYYRLATPRIYTDLIYRDSESFADNTPVTLPVNYKVDNWGIERIAPQNTEEAVLTTKPELTMRYSIDAVEELNTHRDEIEDLYEKNEELDQRKPEKYGEYPDMAVGSANTLAGQDTKVEDFVFKAIDCADGLAKLNSARGKSLVWNQLAKNGNFANGTTNWSAYNGTISASSGIVSFTCNSVPVDTYSLRITQTFASLQHKYLIRYEIKPAHDTKTQATLYSNPTAVNISGGVWNMVSFILANSSAGTSFALWLDTSKTSAVDDVTQVRNITIFDLTLMFGAGNEPATVEEFEAMFPLPYYDYNPGEIISNKTEEVKVVGFNQWDEEWESGIWSSVGDKTADANNIRSKGYIPVIAGNYYLKSVHTIRVCAYDAQKNFIAMIYNGVRNQIVKFNEGTSFITICTRDGATNYANDICINLFDPARNGEYEPYKTNTIELNIPTLTGKLNGEGESVVVFPDGLNSAGSVYDEIVGNKAIKRIGKADLGTLTYIYSSGVFIAAVGNMYSVTSASEARKNGILSTKYCADSQINAYAPNMNDKTMLRSSLSGNAVIVIRDDSYTDGATFKSAMSGVLLYYELATPEEYILDAPLPDTFQAYKGGTIKQLPENTSEPVTAPCVMLATYSIDAVATLVGLPRNYVSKESLQAMLNAMQSAGIIASYTMTYNENTGKYDFTFVAPTNS